MLIEDREVVENSDFNDTFEKVESEENKEELKDVSGDKIQPTKQIQKFSSCYQHLICVFVKETLNRHQPFASSWFVNLYSYCIFSHLLSSFSICVRTIFAVWIRAFPLVLLLCIRMRVFTISVRTVFGIVYSHCTMCSL